MTQFDYEEYSNDLPQYLGTPGITMSCVKAMATILLGLSHPQLITLVCCQEYSEADHDGVLFVVWGWLGCDRLTIVPNGFGTHGGEGGAGLETVLALIRHTKIPLLQLRVWKEMFDELTCGKVSDKTFKFLKRAKAYNWGYYPVECIESKIIGNVEFIEVDYWKFSRVLSSQVAD